MIPKTWDSVKPLCLKQLGHVLTFPICFRISIPNNSLSVQENMYTPFYTQEHFKYSLTKYFLFGWDFFFFFKKIFSLHLLTEHG